jgi:type IV secretory pathway VirB10-like protein
MVIITIAPPPSSYCGGPFLARRRDEFGEGPRLGLGKTLMLACVANAAVLATLPFTPQPVFAQNDTYVAPDQGQSGENQSSQQMRKRKQTTDDQSSGEMKKRHMEGQSDDQQVSQDTKRRHMEGQTNEEQSSREVRRDGREAMGRTGMANGCAIAKGDFGITMTAITMRRPGGPLVS